MKSYHVAITLLCSLLVVFLGYHKPIIVDVTYNQVNTLSDPNKALLADLNDPLTIELITPNQNIHERIKATVGLFQRENSLVEFKATRAHLAPKEKQKWGLKTSHHLLITYQGVTKGFDVNRTQWGEKTLANHIHQLLHQQDEWIVFLTGHDEQDPFGQSNRDLSTLSHELKSQGFHVALLNLAETPFIPDNTKTLVLADNRFPLLPAEIQLLERYIKKGGNFLWLRSPDAPPAPSSLEKLLEIDWLGGTILDPNGTTMGTPDPAICVVTHYPKHPITPFKTLSVFPWATPLQSHSSQWSHEALLTTHPTTYLDNAKQHSGPFTIGTVLTRKDQRIVVIGNTHFLSNASVHNYGNLPLAMNLFHWLTDLSFAPPTHSTATQSPPPALPTPWMQTSIQFGFPYLLPALYLVLGWWLQRRRRQPTRRP